LRIDSRRPIAALVTALVIGAGAGGCGSEGGGARTPTIKWYIFNEPSGAFEQAIKTCNAQASGSYKISYVRLPTNADQQRELVARRLAAKDSDIDIVGMDVIWTAEFAEAGWVVPWTGANRAKAVEDKLAGPLKTVQYQGKVWALPFTTNTQILWYRKDLVKTPPTTWDQMIDEAVKLKKSIEVQAARYEGYTVWVNSLIASDGGQIVDQNGNVKVNDTAKRAAEIIKRLSTSPAAPPGESNNMENEARLGFESGRSAFQVNYTFVYASAKALGDKKLLKNFGWARWPRVDPSKPSRVTLGGINLGIGAYSKHKDLAFQAALCLAQPDNQIVATEKGGLPPTTTALYDNPKIKAAFPFATLLRQTLDEGVPRPVSPAYNDISLAIQKTFHPPEKVDPNAVVGDLRDKLDKAAEGKIF
jgi:multiple sugar transport system substrate-binding protein